MKISNDNKSLASKIGYLVYSYMKKQEDNASAIKNLHHKNIRDLKIIIAFFSLLAIFSLFAIPENFQRNIKGEISYSVIVSSPIDFFASEEFDKGQYIQEGKYRAVQYLIEQPDTKIGISKNICEGEFCHQFMLLDRHEKKPHIVKFTQHNGKLLYVEIGDQKLAQPFIDSALGFRDIFIMTE